MVHKSGKEVRQKIKFGKVNLKVQNCLSLKILFWDRVVIRYAQGGCLAVRTMRIEKMLTLEVRSVEVGSEYKEVLKSGR